MLAALQETIVHQAAVEFAVERFKEAERPRGSIILAAAEQLADSIAAKERERGAQSVMAAEATREAVLHAFQHKVGKVLAVLRNESEERRTYRGGGL